jgi:5-methyltetrahydropteroyltriglutamate--homocysteine methyltransferase
VWDIRSPRVPTAEEMAGLLRRATDRIAPGRTWMNPTATL